MGTKLSHEQIGLLDTRLFALRDKTISGVRPLQSVLDGLQDLFEGKFSRDAIRTTFQDAPSWFVSPERQLEKARSLWSNREFPAPPEHFVPSSPKAVLLLHVPDTFDHLWSFVRAPQGYTTWRWDDLKATKRSLCLAPNVPNRTEPVWLEFDPSANQGVRPDSLWGRSDLAASEVLSALIQFPDWPLSWFKDGNPAPNLAGYQFFWDRAWAHVPYLGRWGDDRQLHLHARWADYAGFSWSSPVVREC